MVASEVMDAPRTFPRALTAALGPLLQYILLAASVTAEVGVLCALSGDG